MSYFADNSLSVGNTPLVQLQKLAGNKATVLGKVEGRNPSYSVKCRIGVGMVQDAEARGVLRPGIEIIEPTSGNTGIALAYVGAVRGYKVTLTMPESMSLERCKIIRAFGAKIVLTEAAKGMPGAIQKATGMVAADPDRYFMPQQFTNPANPATHEQSTGPEIWEATNGRIDVLIAGVGTGGTITGVSRYFKNTQGRNVIAVAVEPQNSPVISQALAGEELKPGPHSIQGIGAGFFPEVLDLTLIDRVEQVGNEEAMDYARRLASEEGMLSGISSGAAVAVAARLVREPEFEGKIIVVILPDSGERYLSTPLFTTE